jgi:hypothetical protein
VTASVGSGLYLSPAEKDPIKQNAAIRQLIEGRSNAVGTLTLTSSTTSGTLVTATNCSTSSTIQLTAISSGAAAELGLVWVTPGRGQFTVSHSTSGSTGRDFSYAIVG